MCSVGKLLKLHAVQPGSRLNKLHFYSWRNVVCKTTAKKIISFSNYWYSFNSALNKSTYCVCQTKYNSLQKMYIPAEICFLTREEKVQKVHLIVVSSLQSSHVNTQLVSAVAALSNMDMPKYGRGSAGAFRGASVAAGGSSVTCLCHMSSAFLAQSPAHWVKHLSDARESQSEAALAKHVMTCFIHFSKKNKM